MNQDRQVIGVFNSPFEADAAVENIMSRGIARDHVSLMVNKSTRDHHFKIDSNKSKTAEGVGYGAVLGGLAAGLGTAAAGIASVTLPGALLITGPLAVSLAAGTAGAAVGGLAGGLIGVGIPEDEVKLVEKEIDDGNILVAAHCLTKEHQKTVTDAFRKSGALRVH